jgi:predicted O-methyltransferase YrrM
LVTQEFRVGIGARLPLPHSLANGLAITRRLVAHPVAITTVGAILRRAPADEADAPWWNKRAVRYLTGLLHPGDRVFEWGSGASTVWLIQQEASVTSVEHDPEWVSKVMERCPAATIRAIPGAAEGHIKSEPGLGDTEHFFDDYVAAIDDFADESLDLVIVDGMSRMECVRRGAPKVKPGGVLMVDDTDFRFLTPHKLLPGWRAVTHSGFKNTRDLRETTFFHKPA